jgi:putative hemolysin
MKNGYFAMAITSAVLLAGCANEPDEYQVKEYTSLANPAAVYCVQQGGELETVTEDAKRVTYCALPNDERVEQWEYYRNSHNQDTENN